MTALNLNNYTLSSFQNEIFCFPLSLPIKHGVDFKITNTAQKKNMFERATFITQKNRCRIFLC